MKRHDSVLALLAVFALLGLSAAPFSSVAQQLSLQQQMDQARSIAADGEEQIFVLRSSGAASASDGVFVFYNNPRPLCYTYMIPGQWFGSPRERAFRSKDGRAFAGVMFALSGKFEGVEGATLVERARNSITKIYERQVRRTLVGVEFIPFESARSGTWQWRAAPITDVVPRVDFPVKIIVDLSPEAVMQITVIGTADDAHLARRIVESLKTTKEPECYFPLLERMLKSESGER